MPAQNLFVRTSGFAMQWEDQSLTVWYRQPRNFFELNPTASLVWTLCNGSLTVAEIIAILQSIDPQQAQEIEHDIRQAIADFQAKGLVVPAAKDKSPGTVKRVAFCNFWDGFSIRDNYFMWLLSFQFDLLIVDPWDEEIDVLFFADFSSSGIDHSQIQSKKCQKVQVCIDRAPDFAQYDYAFSSGSVHGDFADRHFQLPWWAMHLDWFRLSSCRESSPARSDYERYQPQVVGNRLCLALFDTIVEPPAQLRSIEHRSLTDHPPRRLTIGMATYDDFDGVYFSVMAIRLFHPEVSKETEIIVLDNNPDSACGEALRGLVSWVDGLRYIPYAEWRSTAVRDVIFREARTPYVLCMDSHVLLAPGSIQGLLDYFSEHPDSNDLLQGPLLGDDLEFRGTHFQPKWNHGMYGVWGLDERIQSTTAEPFEIPMQGLGLFACRKEAWLGFNPRFRGFGGEEGYIHEKFRQAGQKTLCLPFLRWVHRFSRPNGILYPIEWADRVANYHIGFRELGLETSAIDEHFLDHVGEEHFDRIKMAVTAELANPLGYFDAIYCINLDSARSRWADMKERFRKLGIDRRIRRFSAVETLRSHHIGCALSHRMIIEKAKRLGLESVLVLEDDAVFLEDTLDHLSRTIPELKQQQWQLFYLGGHRRGRHYQPPEDCDHINHVDGPLTCTHGIAYHQSVYQQLLDALPETMEEMKLWLETHRGIDQFLQRFEQRYLADPVVASQPALLPAEDPAYRAQFTI